MTRIYRPRSSVGSLLSGTVGGVLAAVLGVALLAGLAWWQGHGGLVPVNAIGAWVVRWLQGADQDAFTHYYPDAFVVGTTVPLVIGGVLGAAFGGMLARLPQDHPLVWGAIAGLVVWAVTWWAVLPALDPVFLDVVRREHWLAAMLVFGGVLGGWVQGARAARQVEVLERGV